MKFEVTHAKKETQFLKLVFHLRCEEEEAYRIAKVECAHSKAKIEERERERRIQMVLSSFWRRRNNRQRSACNIEELEKLGRTE